MSVPCIHKTHPTLRKLCWTAFTNGGLRELALHCSHVNLTFATLDQAERFSKRTAGAQPPTPTWGNRFRVTAPFCLNTSRLPRAAAYAHAVGDVRQFNRLMFQTGFRNF